MREAHEASHGSYIRSADNLKKALESRDSPEARAVTLYRPHPLASLPIGQQPSEGTIDPVPSTLNTARKHVLIGRRGSCAPTS
jgi:hypothetical protein